MVRHPDPSTLPADGYVDPRTLDREILNELRHGFSAHYPLPRIEICCLAPLPSVYAADTFAPTEPVSVHAYTLVSVRTTEDIRPGIGHNRTHSWLAFYKPPHENKPTTQDVTDGD